MPEIRPTALSKRPRRKLQTPNPEVRARLMDAAIDVLKEHGFPALRIEEIVERAGLSVGTFYLYFDSKADLFVAMVTEYTQRLIDRISKAYEGDDHVAVRMSRGLEAYLDFVEEYEKGFLYFVSAADNIETSVGRLSTWVFQQHAAILQPLVEKAQADGDMKKMDPELVAQALLGLAQHMAAFWLQHRERLPREKLRDFMNMFTAFGLSPASY